MSEIEVHQRERGEDSERHLSENQKTFKRDLDFVLMLMRNGRRLTAKSLMQEFGIPDRRLRDAYQNRETIKKDTGCEVKREWKLSDKGKRMCVEYFIVLPRPHPSKNQLQIIFRSPQ